MDKKTLKIRGNIWLKLTLCQNLEKFCRKRLTGHGGSAYKLPPTPVANRKEVSSVFFSPRWRVKRSLTLLNGREVRAAGFICKLSLIHI